MDKKNLIQYIQQVLPMNESIADQIVEKFNPMKIERSTHLLNAGDICNVSSFLEKGIMRSYTYDSDHNEVTTMFYQANSYVGDVLSFYKRTPAKECVQAITDCEIWVMTYEDMQDSFHSIPEFREFGRLNLVSQYNRLKEIMLSSLQETAEKRYGDLICSNEDILQHVPLKYIASYLGVADTSLSRIRKEFIKK